MTDAEFIAMHPPAPCGEPLVHWQWEKIEGMRCPKCSGNRKRLERDGDERRMVGLIADAVVARMKESA